MLLFQVWVDGVACCGVISVRTADFARSSSLRVQFKSQDLTLSKIPEWI